MGDRAAGAAVDPEGVDVPLIDDQVLSQIEKSHARGLTSAEILDVFARHDVQLSEATLRKYVQLGLLPRSVRIGKKGKHQGSQGVYPVSVVRQILRIKQMMAESYTIRSRKNSCSFAATCSSSSSYSKAFSRSSTPC
jgi:hypothetical protein